MEADVAVVGAGVAGLTCARRLVEAGRHVLVLEKSRGVGGRCATRRVGDTVVDHGLTFYHGSDEELRSSLKNACGDGVVPQWPRRIRGTGQPCQPRAFREGDWRLACADGVTAFPKWLASGIDVRLNSRVAAVEPAGDRWRIVDEAGRSVAARDLVLTVPAAQALELFDSSRGEPRGLDTMRFLLREIGFASTLTVMALYPAGGPAPDWDMWYPEDSAILQLVSHDSSKRRNAARTVLVLQALPAWSRTQWDRPVEEWSSAMLEDAGRLTGSWAAAPETTRTHRWRFARIASGDLSGPMLVALPEGRRLGLAGDGFSPGGGVQAAWRSGRELARRLLEGPPV